MRIRQSQSDWRHVYEIYLASPEWRAKRDAVLRRDHYLCQCCLQRRAVTAHHRLYPSPATPEAFVHQPCYQLSAICEPCHAMFDGTMFVGVRK